MSPQHHLNGPSSADAEIRLALVVTCIVGSIVFLPLHLVFHCGAVTATIVFSTILGLSVLFPRQLRMILHRFIVEPFTAWVNKRFPTQEN